MQKRDIMVDRKVCITGNDRIQTKELQIIQWQMNVETAEKKKKKKVPLHSKGGDWYERT